MGRPIVGLEKLDSGTIEFDRNDSGAKGRLILRS
jgi:hypothetical protein